MLGVVWVGGVVLLNSNRLNGRFAVTTGQTKRCIVTYSGCSGTPTVRMTSRQRIFSVLSNSTLATIIRGRRPSVVIPRVRTVHARHLFSFRGRNVRVMPSTHTIGCAVGHHTVHSLTTGRLNLHATGCFCTGAFRRFGGTTSRVNFPYMMGPLVDSDNRKRDCIRGSSRLGRTCGRTVRRNHNSIGRMVVRRFVSFSSRFALLAMARGSNPALFYPPVKRMRGNNSCHRD